MVLIDLLDYGPKHVTRTPPPHGVRRRGCTSTEYGALRTPLAVTPVLMGKVLDTVGLSV